MVPCSRGMSGTVRSTESKRRHDIARSRSAKKLRPTIADRWRNGDARPFIGWDGEGYDYYRVDSLGNISRLHRYMLFGSSQEPASPLVGMDLRSGPLLDYMCSFAQSSGSVHNIAFKFSYDVNMILCDLPRQGWRVLKKYGRCSYSGFSIEYIPNKIFRVRRRGADQKWFRLEDMFLFFNTSYIRALDNFGVTTPHLERIRSGKAARGTFTWSDIAMVLSYWQAEIGCMPALAEKVREACYANGINITAWHGPGAIASYMLGHNGIKSHMSDEDTVPEEVKIARRHAYAGGRFHPFQFGHWRYPVYTYDINSAYASAMRSCPSLRGGVWFRRPGHSLSFPVPDFGLYELEYRYGNDDAWTRPHPLFFRERRGQASRLSWPPVSHGWYWGPEANDALASGHAIIRDGWVYSHDGVLPFRNFIEDAYQQRMELKRAGNMAQLSYKWGLASFYGRVAQRVGWNRETREAPNWHQLEWAGYLTSSCRSAVYNVAMKAWNYHPNTLVSIDTDSVTTLQPVEFDKGELGDNLGQWGAETYSQAVFWQSGVYWLLGSDNHWLPPKSRGLPRGSVPVEAAIKAIETLEAAPLDSKTRLEASRRCVVQSARTTFHGIESSLLSMSATDRNYWQTGTYESQFAGGTHAVFCRKCSDPQYPAHLLHNTGTVIRADQDMSAPHHLPWLEEETEERSAYGATDLDTGEELALYDFREEM
jgi:DNA polymerase type B, organellar and viral